MLSLNTTTPPRAGLAPRRKLGRRPRRLYGTRAVRLGQVDFDKLTIPEKRKIVDKLKRTYWANYRTMDLWSPTVERLDKERADAWASANDMIKGGWEVAPGSKEAYRRYNLMAAVARELDGLYGRVDVLVRDAKQAMKDAEPIIAELDRWEADVYRTTPAGLGIAWAPVIAVAAAAAVLGTCAYFYYVRVTENREVSDLMSAAISAAKRGDQDGINKIIAEVRGLLPDPVVDQVAKDLAEGDTKLAEELKKSAEKETEALGKGAGMFKGITTAALVVIGGLLALELVKRRKGK